MTRPDSTTRSPRTIRLDNLGPVCRGSCDIDGDDHYHAARLEDRSGAAPAKAGDYIIVTTPAGPAVDPGNQDAGGIPRGPWDDRR